MADPEHERRLMAIAAGGEREETLEGADLSGARFTSYRLVGVCLKGANLRKADGSGAYLQGVDLSQANLTSVRMVCADLRNARLTGAILKNADFNSAMLRDADLQSADLTGCKLTRADLTRAALAGAKLTKTDLRGAKGLTPAQVQQARNWDQAIYDESLARFLRLKQDQKTSRRGIVKPRSKRGCYQLDLVELSSPLEFGDLFLLTGDEHPDFPPTGKFKLAALANLGFQQVDDYLATANETIWLNPLGVRSPFHGLRLELTSRTQRNIDRFLSVVAALADCLGAQLRLVESDGYPGELTTIASVRKELEASLKPRAPTGRLDRHD